MKLTQEEKTARREARKVERSLQKQLATIEAEKNQKPVKEITISIEWRKSRTWGSNPHAEAKVYYKDGTFERRNGFTCSGCGYDKESTVIADIFNTFLKYKLYQRRRLVDSINGQKSNHPYGVYYYNGKAQLSDDGKYYFKPSFNGGVGMSCYISYNSEKYDRSIARFIGGKLEHTARGKTFDVYTYIDLSK